jgi:hypothetical protein
MQTRTTLMLALLVIAAGAFSGVAHAGPIIVDLDATDPANGYTLYVNPTDEIVVTQIGTEEGGKYDAWNAWGRVTCSEADGCPAGTGVNGWINNWSYYFDGESTDPVLVADGLRYPDADLALANAVSVDPFTGMYSITFFINDRPYSDNVGGISLLVDVRKQVPEPGTLGLLGLGLVGLGFVQRRRRKI